jgi:hypothetical protein
MTYTKTEQFVVKISYYTVVDAENANEAKDMAVESHDFGSCDYAVHPLKSDGDNSLSSGDWKPMDTEDGCACFCGKSHYSLSENLPSHALEHNHEDIDFLVVGWRI